jgi:RNA polymerase sigma-70 factor (ECF subfamily)
MPVYGNSPSLDLGAIEPDELVRRAQDGCRDSFTELTNRFRPRLLNLLRNRLGDRNSDAEDLVQEALARAFQHFDRFDQRYRFSTWLYTIAIRLAHDHARSRRRRPRHVPLDESACESRESNAAVLAQRQEDVDNLWHTARLILSDAQYTALWLRYAEDLSAVEVAQIMGKSRIGVRVLLHRARLRLVAEIARQDPASPTRG